MNDLPESVEVGLNEAIAQAEKSWAEGGIPIGAIPATLILKHLFAKVISMPFANI